MGTVWLLKKTASVSCDIHIPEVILMDLDSEQVLPKVFNGPFLKRDQKAYDALDKVIQERGSFSKKR
jgi:hypothetical protein